MGAGVASNINPSQASKGVGKDRLVQQQLNQLRDDEDTARLQKESTSCNASPLEMAERENIRLKGEVASARLEMQRLAELTSNDSHHSSQ